MKGIGKRYGEGESGIGERNIGAIRDYMNCLWVIKEITNKG